MKELTVGTVKNICTNVSWLRTGCWTTWLANLVRPLRRFSRKFATSPARWVPLTNSCQQPAFHISGVLTLHSLWREQRKSSEWVSLLQTVEEPDKVTVPPHNATALPDRLNLIVVVLKQEHAFLLRQKCDHNRLAGTRRHSYTADCALWLVTCSA